MKIRIQGDSIRFRLTRSEVETLCSEGQIEEVTHFGENQFRYAIKSKAIEGMQAYFADNTLTLGVDSSLILHWDKDERVGFDSTLPVEGDRSLYLLLEKDFVCMDRRLEDQSDNYPNPKLQT